MSPPGRLLLLPLAAAALTAGAIAGAAATGPAAPKPFLRYAVRSDGTIAGAPSVKVMSWATGSPVLPKAWTVRSRSLTKLRLRTEKTACPYDVTVTVRMVAAPPAPAPAYVAAAVPGSGAYVEDSGTRNAAAWRVVRGTGDQSLRGLLASSTAASFWTSRLPAGDVLWRELRIDAKKVRPQGCHSGFYRTVAQQIGDGLAAAASR